MAPNTRSKKPDPALVQEFFDYYEDGSLQWAKGHVQGKVAGCYSNGRCVIRFCGVMIQRSHLVFAWHNGRWPKEQAQIDHINRDALDDRIENLREVSSSANCRNRSSSLEQLFHVTKSRSTNPCVVFSQAIPPEIFEQKCGELQAFLQPWVQSIEDYLLGNLPEVDRSEEEAVEANQCSEDDYLDSLQQLSQQ